MSEEGRVAALTGWYTSELRGQGSHNGCLSSKALLESRSEPPETAWVSTRKGVKTEGRILGTQCPLAGGLSRKLSWQS